MAHDPNRRYASAEQIVKDVQNFLADEPVSVFEDPIWMKVVRWCKRHPAITSGVFGAVAVFTLSSLIFGAVIRRAHQAEQRARIAAENAKKQAVERLAEARQAGDAWLIDLSGALQFYPGLGGMRSDLLQQAIDHYQHLADELDSDATHQDEEILERAKCDIRLGDLYRLLGKNSEAMQSYAEANSRLESPHGTQLARRSEKRGKQFAIEAINARIGSCLLTGKTPTHLDDDVRWLRAELTDGATDVDAETKRRVASTLARLQLAIARTAPAADVKQVDRLKDAERWAQYLVRKRGEPRDHQLLQTTRDDLANACEERGDCLESLRIWHDELVRLDDLIGSATKRPDLLQSRAFVAMKYATTLARTGQEAKATSYYKSASSDLERAWQLSDADAFYQRNTAISKANLGQLAARLVTYDISAEDYLVEAIDHLGQAVAADGPKVYDLVRLAACYESLGSLAARKGESTALNRFDLAEQCYQVIADHGLIDSQVTLKRIATLTARADALLSKQQANQANTVLQKARGLLNIARNDETLGERDKRQVERLKASIMRRTAMALEQSGEHEAAFALREELQRELERWSTEEIETGASGPFPWATFALVDLQLELTDTGSNHLQQVLGLIESIRDAKPNMTETADWQLRYGQLQWLLGNRGRARDAIQRADELRPGDPLVEVMRLGATQRRDNLAGESVRESLRELASSLPGDRHVALWVERILSDRRDEVGED